MKWRYYLRGLSAGMIAAALMIGIGGKEQAHTLSDTEIRQRAEQLGMVDRGNLILSDLKNTQEQGKEEKKADSETIESSQQSTAAEQEASEQDTDSEQESITGEEESQESQSFESSETESSENEPDQVEITIISGENSLEICEALQEAGLIEDAESFDNYLISNGYSRYIKAGIHEIPIGISEEEIAQIIMKKPKRKVQ